MFSGGFQQVFSDLVLFIFRNQDKGNQILNVYKDQELELILFSS